MMTTPRHPRFIQRYVADAASERASAQRDLLAPAASIAPKFFYDRLGSHLFEAITELPEYYPTRTEAAIFAVHGAEMARRIGSGSTLIDLGAGNCAKAARLFPLLEPRAYVAIDISVEFLREALRQVQREQPSIEMTGLGIDFSNDLELPPDLVTGTPVFFYPGSSIGNFAPDDALALLRRVHAHAAGGGLLIGVDLAKPASLLEPAYDDALGVTAAFNLNVLRHLNRVIGADFDPARWRHVAFYDAAAARIEMHLEARVAQTVRWPGGERRFAAGERIHTENSHKFGIDAFEALLHEAGYTRVSCWTDPARWFAVFWAHA
jgi:L-histidine N-alpha-methyltransferase